MLRIRLLQVLGISVFLLWIPGISAILLALNPAGAQAMLVTGSGDPGGGTGTIVLLVSTMAVIGTLSAVAVYFLVLRHLEQPAASLRPAREAIRAGNNDASVPAPDQAGEPAGPVATVNGLASPSDVPAARKEPECQVLERADMMNRAIIEAIPSPVFVMEDDGGFIRVNPAAEKLSEDLRVAGRLPSKIQQLLAKCRKDQRHYMPQDPQDAVVFRIHDEDVYFLPRIFRFDSGTEAVSGWAVVLHNVSRIRWLDDMKTNYIATVSHEIKTPLTCIRMVLLLLLEGRSSPLDPTQQTLVSSASGDCERLLSTVNNLLALSLAESGATHLNRIPLSLQSCVEGMVDQFEKSANTRGVELRIEGNDEGFPKVLADPVRLAEVMENLISNAVNHSPESGEIIMRISKPDAEHIRLSVLDQGTGVAESCQARIFERFYRAPGQKTKGLGLGLFIARDIMTAHQGRIGLLDRTDNLTEFFIDVPIA